MGFQKRLILSSAAACALLAAPSICFAAAGAQALAGFIQAHIIVQALAAFWGISAAGVFYYAVRMVLEAYSEQSYTDLANSFIHVLTGFAIIACAAAFANAFATSATSSGNISDVNPILLAPSINSVSNFIITMSAGLFVLMVVIAGARMLITQGEEGEFKKWTKVLVYNCIGVVIMFIAGAIVTGVSDTRPGAMIEEMRGLAVFILTLIGFCSVLALIIAGILLIVSVDESLRDKAKKTITGTLITLGFVLAAYTLIVIFVQ